MYLKHLYLQKMQYIREYVMVSHCTAILHVYIYTHKCTGSVDADEAQALCVVLFDDEGDL